MQYADPLSLAKATAQHFGPKSPEDDTKNNPPKYCSAGNNKRSTTKPELQKVTQDVIGIIKNLTSQLREISAARFVPTDVTVDALQKKAKKFFDRVPPAPTKPSAIKSPTTIVINLKGQRARSANSSATTSSSNAKPSRPSTNSLPRNYRILNNNPRNNSSASSSTPSRGGSGLPVPDTLKTLTDDVQRAIREKKTFTIRGRFPAVRRALLQRGWVEKLYYSYRDQLTANMRQLNSYDVQELAVMVRNKEFTQTCTTLIRSKLLGTHQVDLYWGGNDEAFKLNPDKIKFTLVNKLKRSVFSYTNKLALSEANNFSHWFNIPGVAKLNHPRSYNLTNNSKKDFTQNFNLTAAMALLKWVVRNDITKESKLVSPSGKIPLDVFDFAINECCKFVKKCKHEDIDQEILEATEQEWTQFLDYFYKIVHYSHHFTANNQETDNSLVKKSIFVLNNLKECWPFLHMDGMMNIWILKPGCSSRGRGIHICRTLSYVLKIIDQNSNLGYVVQKYIERPLLIYNTKFDIRQWFLISSTCPMTIWIYKESYLRFSSQTYNLRKLHESIHLTNNAVQCKYKTANTDAALPNYNMWDTAQFKDYLSNIGYPDAFRNIIYPGMKQNITAAVLMHEDKMIYRKNCFELFGADFIITENFQPWLLEINSHPALDASTPITARMCPKVLEDVIKVVVDHERNFKAGTGSFELLYKQQATSVPSPTPQLELQGHSLEGSYFFTPPEPPREPPNPTETYLNLKDINFRSFGDEIRHTLTNLLRLVKEEKAKRETERKTVACWTNQEQIVQRNATSHIT